MNRLGLLFLLLTISYFGNGQITIKQQNISDVEVDNLQNIYLISGAELKKYNAEGDLLFQYSNGIYGQITSIDVSNPLRILLFFRESNAMVFLNQQLAELSDPVEVDGLGDIQAELVCTSKSGGFWIFDEIEQCIIHFSNHRIETTRTQNILSLSNSFIAHSLQELHGKLYLSSKQNNTLIFDQFGTYMQKLPFSIRSKVQSNNKVLSLWNGTAWMEYNQLTKNTINVFEISDEKVKKIVRNNSNWLVQFPNWLEIKKQ